jgi:hypothetical protein
MSYYVTNENSFLDIKNAHLRVTGNVHTDVLKVGSIGFQPTGSNIPGTVNFTNVTTGVTTSSNLDVGGTLNLGTVELSASTHTLGHVTARGNVTSTTVQFDNATTGLVTTANVEVGGELTVSSNIEVAGFVGTSGTGAIVVPSGTTAQQPTGVAGMIRFNSTLNRLEVYNGTVWLSIAGISATGGTITNADGYTIHTFTSSGTFTMIAGGDVDYLIVAGGGGGGSRHAGGGGAGGVLYGTISKSPGPYTVTVGNGGAGHNGSPSANGTNGSPSQITNWLSGGATASTDGGGGGGSGYHVSATSALSRVGSAGGSGGGGGPYHGGGSGTSGQGFNGGSGGNDSNAGHGGGGGGAGGVGGNSVGPYTSNEGISGAGGIGYTSSITGRPVIYAGGGSGGRWTGNNTNPGRAISVGTVEGGGGLGGAETLNAYNNYDGQNAEANTGGGGGGGGDSGGPGGNGGSGIVILRYLL